MSYADMKKRMGLALAAMTASLLKTGLSAFEAEFQAFERLNPGPRRKGHRNRKAERFTGAKRHAKHKAKRRRQRARAA